MEVFCGYQPLFSNWWICLLLITLFSCQICQHLQTFASKVSGCKAKLINNNHTIIWKIHPQTVYLQNTKQDFANKYLKIWEFQKIFEKYLLCTFILLFFTVLIFKILYILLHKHNKRKYFNVKRYWTQFHSATLGRGRTENVGADKKSPNLSLCSRDNINCDTGPWHWTAWKCHLNMP